MNEDISTRPDFHHSDEMGHETARDVEGDTVYYWCRECDWTAFSPLLVGDWVADDAPAFQRAVDAAAAAGRDTYARYLHDVVFTFGKPIPTFDELQPKTREWFRNRAGLLMDGLALTSITPGPADARIALTPEQRKSLTLTTDESILCVGDVEATPIRVWRLSHGTAETRTGSHTCPRVWPTRTCHGWTKAPLSAAATCMSIRSRTAA